MDTDGGRRYISNIFVNILTILIYLNYVFNNEDVYFISHNELIKLIEKRLNEEGYNIKRIKKGVYKIYPVLYGERD